MNIKGIGMLKRPSVAQALAVMGFLAIAGASAADVLLSCLADVSAAGTSTSRVFRIEPG